MANPAEALHNILTEWRQDRTKQIYIHRGTAASGSDADMRKHRQAIALINEIDQILTSIERPDHRKAAHERTLGRLTKWVMAYPHDWLLAPKDGYPNLDDQGTLDYLDSIATLLENYVRTFSDAERDGFADILNGVVKSLAEDDSLPVDLRRHLHLLISEARRCVEEYEIVGDFALQAAMERLSAAVSTATKVTKHPGKWSSFMDKYVWPSAVGITVGSAQLAITAGTAGS